MDRQTAKAKGQDLYYELEEYSTYNAHRKAAYKSRVTRLANRIPDAEHDPELDFEQARWYIESIAKQLPDYDLDGFGSKLEPESKDDDYILPPVYRISLVRDPNENIFDRPQITGPTSALALARAYLSGADRENFIVLALDTKNRVIGINTVFVGSIDTIVTRQAEIFKSAILCNAAAIIIAHNHPSGDPTPSADDIFTTQKIRDAGEILGIPLVDHLIIGQDHRYHSLKSEKQI
jgi:DNA repair protein RadC